MDGGHNRKSVRIHAQTHARIVGMLVFSVVDSVRMGRTGSTAMRGPLCGHVSSGQLFTMFIF